MYSQTGASSAHALVPEPRSTPEVSDRQPAAPEVSDEEEDNNVVQCALGTEERSTDATSNAVRVCGGDASSDGSTNVIPPPPLRCPPGSSAHMRPGNI